LNIEDVKEKIDIPDNIWKEIFKKQKSLIEKYKIIEKMPLDILQTGNINIDTRKGQEIIKSMAWRVTEELAEAEEAKILYTKEENPELAQPYYTHYLEELTDALHFLVEMTLIAGYTSDLPEMLYIDHSKYEETSAWDVVYYLGLMCNCLKNKPWKQTEMLTDRPKFEKYLKQAWIRMIRIFKDCDLEEKDIYTLYFKKQCVNLFRIRSKY